MAKIPYQFVTQRLAQVAKYQRWILLLVLLSLFGLGHVLVFAAISVLNAVFLYRLAKLLDMKAPLLTAIVCFIPVIGIFGLLHVNQQATSTLRRNGLRVGLLGVAPSECRKLEDR